LTTNAGSIPEVVGDQGILIEAGDPLVLKTAIEKSLANLPKHQPQLQQNVIKNKYSWEATAQQYISQYTSL
jgi:glycosyltransferase involved in cell wall biosynthesis